MTTPPPEKVNKGYHLLASSSVKTLTFPNIETTAFLSIQRVANLCSSQGARPAVVVLCMVKGQTRSEGQEMAFKGIAFFTAVWYTLFKGRVRPI